MSENAQSNFMSSESLTADAGNLNPVETAVDTAPAPTQVPEKGAFRRGLESIGGKAKEWVQSRWEKLKTVAGNWRDTVIDTIKLNTVDKWNYLADKSDYNKIIGKKQEEILSIGSQIALDKSRAETLKADKAAEDQKFEAALATMTDPELQAVFGANKESKQKQYDADSAVIDQSISGLEGAQSIKSQEIETFQKDIKGAGETFSQNIDSKITNLKDRYNYDESVEKLGTLDTQIEKTKGNLELGTKKIADYENALQHSNLLDSTSRVMLEGKLAQFKQETALTRGTLEKAQAAKEKLQDKIAKIDKKMQKWEALKTKYGLNPAENVELEPETSLETEGVAAEQEPYLGRIPMNADGSAGVEVLSEEERAKKEAIEKKQEEALEAIGEPAQELIDVLSVSGPIDSQKTMEVMKKLRLAIIENEHDLDETYSISASAAIEELDKIRKEFEKTQDSTELRESLQKDVVEKHLNVTTEVVLNS